MNKNSQEKAKPSKFAKKVARYLWVFFGLGVVAVTILFVLIAYGYIGYMPPIEDLENPKDKFASEIYSSDMEGFLLLYLLTLFSQHFLLLFLY